MSRIHWQDHIIIDPDIHHGDPCIKGTHIPVATVIGRLADGMLPTDIQAAYPQLADYELDTTLADDYPATLMTQLAGASGAYEWMNDPAEDIYSDADGEAM